MAGESATGLTWLDQAMQPKFSKEELALRDLFVEEYLKDYDAYAAALRCGFNGQFAKEYAQRFMDESYVRQRIKARELEAASESRANTEHIKRQVRAGLLREAHQWGGSQAARVSALTTLARMYGMDAPAQKGPGGQGGKLRGVIVLKERIDSAEAWEAKALASQQKLITDSRTT